MRKISPLMVALTMFTLVRIAQAKQVFEGTAWNVKVTPDEDARKAGEKAFDDTLVFKGGKFSAEACCKKYGFDAVGYDEVPSPGGMGTFTATLKSDKEGTAKWTGTVTAGEIKGELMWTKKDGTELHYTYTGERKG